jgi:hypothetical protein
MSECLWEVPYSSTRSICTCLIFIAGSNWIPADNLFTRITDSKYRHLLELAREGNQIMVRIWGGGIYEPDIFFDLCDGKLTSFVCLF